MNWNYLTDSSQLIRLQQASELTLIFKHSTRCSISNAVLNRLERNWNTEEMRGITPYFLDLLSYRNISDKITGLFGVPHESPQALIIRNGKTIYHASHFEIQYEQLLKAVRS
ncbi:MAG: bacillithiol system redox-active protein YtxJ [Flammeovirgaceae bacterium]|nr:MAG: bacillithiol system redox-active protein YtxJ [Flammeovirgaceae bacterium]